MQKLTKTDKKLNVLKAILNGEVKLSTLLPPKHYFVMQNPDGLYNIPGTDLLCNEEMLQQWIKARREMDKVIILTPQPGGEPLIEDEDVSKGDSRVFDIDYVEVVVNKKPKHKTKPLETPVNEPQDILTQVIPKQLIRAGKLSTYGIEWGSICDA